MGWLVVVRGLKRRENGARGGRTSGEREREEKEGRTKRVGGVLLQRCETNIQDGVPNRG